ncbi:ThiF family adenylyltransferase [Psychrobacter sp. DM4]|uniref:ThiF family adenylyltransferase n=1 Tax=Psychrobacter sp. DM4 TaxID=3440637 RepID=UPI003F508B2C
MNKIAGHNILDLERSYNQVQDRYQRQIGVSQLKLLGQQRLLDSHVAIVGMGGLGSPASLYLAGAGVGKLTLIDHDIVSLTNLHRQILYREADIDHYKAETARDTLIQLNYDIEIISHNLRLTASNIDDLLAEATVIVDASDNFALSYLLSDFCLKTRKPLVSASVMGVTGYVGVFCHSSIKGQSDCPSMRAIFPSPPPADQNCNSVGVIGTAAGIMGILQAQEVIKVVVQDKHQLAGRLLSLDMWSYRQTIIDFTGATEPENCVKIIAKSDIRQDDSTNKNADQDWIIDVRSSAEVAQQPKFCDQHQPINQSDPNYNAQSLRTLPRDKRLVFTCASGSRALMVADMAIQQGFEKVAVWL